LQEISKNSLTQTHCRKQSRHAIIAPLQYSGVLPDAGEWWK